MLFGGNTCLVIGETKLYFWSVQPTYLSFSDLIVKEKPIYIRVWNTLLLGGNTRVVMGETKLYDWFIQPMYLSFRDLVVKEKPIIHPSMEYLVVRR